MAVSTGTTSGNGPKQKCNILDFLISVYFCNAVLRCFLDLCCNLDINVAVLRQYSRGQVINKA